MIALVQFAVGLFFVMAILMSAIRTVVLPHAGAVRITRMVFRSFRRVGTFYGRFDRSIHRRHSVMQVSVAFALLSLPVLWLSVALSGYTLMFRGLGTDSWRDSYDLAGSSLFTLGFAKPDDLVRLTLAFSASALAISILALLLVTYSPTIYQAYTARESFLTAFEAIAGDPPNVTGMVVRAHELATLDQLSVLWIGWREWFADLRESHTALPAISFLGSSRPDRNWVATVGTLLDCAATSLAVLDTRAGRAPTRRCVSERGAWRCATSPNTSGSRSTTIRRPALRSASIGADSTRRTTRWSRPVSRTSIVTRHGWIGRGGG